VTKLLGWDRTQGSRTRGYTMTSHLSDTDWYEIERSNVRGSVYFTVYRDGEAVGSRGTLGLAKSLAEDDARLRAREARAGARHNPKRSMGSSVLAPERKHAAAFAKAVVAATRKALPRAHVSAASDVSWKPGWTRTLVARVTAATSTGPVTFDAVAHQDEPAGLVQGFVAVADGSLTGQVIPTGSFRGSPEDYARRMVSEAASVLRAYAGTKVNPSGARARRNPFTVECRNELLGRVHNTGTFDTFEAADEYARDQAARSRNFATFQVLSGTPKNDGREAGPLHRGHA
jgi:hypothetical protein